MILSSGPSILLPFILSPPRVSSSVLVLVALVAGAFSICRVSGHYSYQKLELPPLVFFISCPRVPCLMLRRCLCSARQTFSVGRHNSTYGLPRSASPPRMSGLHLILISVSCSLAIGFVPFQSAGSFPHLDNKRGTPLRHPSPWSFTPPFPLLFRRFCAASVSYCLWWYPLSVGRVLWIPDSTGASLPQSVSSVLSLAFIYCIATVVCRLCACGMAFPVRFKAKGLVY
jgi:hypothetical protein